MSTPATTPEPKKPTPAVKRPRFQDLRTDQSGVILKDSRPGLVGLQKALEQGADGGKDPGAERIEEIRRIYQQRLFAVMLDKRVLWALQQLLTCRNARIRIDAFKLVMLHMVPLPKEEGSGEPRQIVINNMIPRPEKPEITPPVDITPPRQVSTDA